MGNKDVLLVIDMVHDFVYGVLGSEYARSIIPNLQKLLSKAREKGVPVVYLKDYHNLSDPEIKHWGAHSMKGEEGSKVIPELAPLNNESVIPKTTYSGFFRTPLETILQGIEIEEIILTGVTTDICVLHNVAESFFRGYKVKVVEDATATFNPQEHERALKYMTEIYGAKILKTGDIIKSWEV